jgi:hypothetical protein
VEVYEVEERWPTGSDTAYVASTEILARQWMIDHGMEESDDISHFALLRVRVDEPNVVKRFHFIGFFDRQGQAISSVPM